MKMWSCEGYIPKKLSNVPSVLLPKFTQWTPKSQRNCTLRNESKTKANRNPPTGYVPIPLESPNRLISPYVQPDITRPKTKSPQLAPKSSDYETNKRRQFDNFRRVSSDIFRAIIKALMVFPRCCSFSPKKT